MSHVPLLSSSTQGDSAQRMYDARASGYDSSWHPSFAAHLVGLAHLLPGCSVLDLACGTGLATAAASVLVGPSGHVVGIDISTGMLAIAAQRASSSPHANVEIHRHDITRLDSLGAITGKRFDAVTCASALVLLDDPSAAVRQWAKFLRPGGYMVVDATTPRTLVPGLVLERTARRLGGKVPWNRDWCKRKEDLKKLLESSGDLCVERIEYVKQTGKGTRWYGVEEADRIFEEQVKVDGGRWLEELEGSRGTEVRKEAKTTFREEWERMAEEGRVRDEDMVWVAVARRVRAI